MRIGFVVNQIETEQASYTTTRLAMAAVNRGHESWLIGTGDLALDPDDYVRARARSAPKAKYKSLDSYLDEVRGPRARAERITVDDLDVLMLRNDPAEDIGRRSWAQMAGIMFGRAALRRGVIVLNDPTALALAANKMYFQLFPEEVRPATLITRDRNEIRHFAREHGGDVVIKPLQGSGGQGVFLVRKNDLGNLNQMIEAVSRDGYVIAQEYLPDAAEGDMRLFVMNGAPLKYKGKVRGLPPPPLRRRYSQQYPRGRQKGPGRRRRSGLADRRNRAAQAGGRRHVSGGPGYRRRQIDGNQRLQPRRPGQRPKLRGRQFRRGRDYGFGA